MHARSSSGFTLVEVLVALALLVVISVGVVQLFAVALTAGRVTRDRTVAVSLATGKMEQLRSLAWGFELNEAGALVARTDVSSDLSVDPPAAGGPGLSESPAGTLDHDTPRYVDYLDRHGRPIEGASAAASSAAYVRRWAVRRLPADPDRVVVLQVLVMTAGRARSRSPAAPHSWNGEDVLLATMMARRAR
jgi:prepilin-type N-terminal cleavage/methylation domain-containing protein